MKRDWAYCRVSIKGDSVVSKSVELQEQLAHDWSQAHGGFLERAFKDDGVSGALFLRRPDYQQMLREAKLHPPDRLLFFDVDRYGRNSRHTMESLHSLADLSIEVWDISNSQRIDLDTFEGRVTATLRAEFAQQYVETIRKKVRFTMRAKAERGEWCGGRPYGYENVVQDGVKTLRIVPAQAKVVGQIYERYAAGHGLHAIMRWLNQSGILSPRGVRGGWSSPIVSHILRRAIYRGWYEYAREEVRWGRETGRPGCERAQVRRPEGPACRVEKPEWRIVPEDLQRRVDTRIKHDSRIYAESHGTGKAPHKSWGRHPCSGFIICPECGTPFQVQSDGNGHKWYVCGARYRRAGSCDSRIRLPLEETDRAILGTLEHELLGGRLIDELLSLVEEAPPDETERLTAERGRLHDNVQRLVKAVAEGSIASATAGQTIRELQESIAKLDARLVSPNQKDPVQERTFRVPSGEIRGGTPARLDVLRAALERQTAEWIDVLRSEPVVARTLLKRLIGPISVHLARNAPPELVPLESERAELLTVRLCLWRCDLHVNLLTEGSSSAALVQAGKPRAP